MSHFIANALRLYYILSMAFTVNYFIPASYLCAVACNNFIYISGEEIILIVTTAIQETKHLSSAINHYLVFALMS